MDALHLLNKRIDFRGRGDMSGEHSLRMRLDVVFTQQATVFYKVNWILWVTGHCGRSRVGARVPHLTPPHFGLDTALSAASENTAGWRQMAVPAEWAAPHTRRPMRLWISVAGLLPSL